MLPDPQGLQQFRKISLTDETRESNVKVNEVGEEINRFMQKECTLNHHISNHKCRKELLTSISTSHLFTIKITFFFFPFRRT